MPEANWYPDNQDPSILRYFDGDRWTDHTRPLDTVGSQRDETTSPGADQSSENEREDSAISALLSIGFIGAFIGLMLGGALLNGLGSLSPITSQPGTLDRLELDISVSQSSSSTSSRRSYILGGRTDQGAPWQIVDDEAYAIVEAEGYPQRVTVDIADWTGKAVRVQTETWEVDRQSTGNRIAWIVAVAFMGVVGIIGTLITFKVTTRPVLNALIFAVGFFVVGNWLGYQAFAWMQSV
jgi:hypothetical protein